MIRPLLKATIQSEYFRARYEVEAWAAGVATALFILYPKSSAAKVAQHFTIQAHTSRVNSDNFRKLALEHLNVPNIPIHTESAEPWEETGI